MLLQTYEYRLQARRPATYIALGVGVVTAYAVAFANALLAGIPVAGYLMVVLWRLWHNPAAGLSFTENRLEVFDPSEHRSFHLSEIRSVRLRTGVFSDDECVLSLRDGRRLALPPDALPQIRKLHREFTRRGISIT